MSDDIEHPQRGYDTRDIEALNTEEAAPVVKKRKRRKWPWVLLAIFVGGPVVVFALWTWIALHWTYSSGERAGVVQKLSHKGWLCKTWEGELLLASSPGTIPEKFYFSVRDDSIAHLVEQASVTGNRVALHYEQHKGVPSDCFGETEYFVTSIREAK